MLLLLFFIPGHTATPPAHWPAPNAKKIMIPVGTTGKWISLMELSTLRVGDFETLREAKLSFFKKISFKLGQRKLRRAINQDRTLNNKALESYAGKIAEGTPDFHTGGFFLGLC